MQYEEVEIIADEEAAERKDTGTACVQDISLGMCRLDIRSGTIHLILIFL